MKAELVAISAIIISLFSGGCNEKGKVIKKQKMDAEAQFKSEKNIGTVDDNSGSNDRKIFCERVGQFLRPGPFNLEGKTLAIYQEDDLLKNENNATIDSCVDYSEKEGHCRFKSRYDSSWTLARCANHFHSGYFGIYCLGTKDNNFLDPACISRYWKEGCQVIGNNYVENRSFKFDGNTFSFTEDGKTFIQAKIVQKGTCEPGKP